MHPYLYVIGPLPRGASGKINTRALASAVPTRATSRTKSQATPPKNRIETALLSIFCAVLHLEGSEKDIGTQANFFELGGNSLLAARLLTRINQQFSCMLHMHIMFSHPTVQQLASVIPSTPHPLPLPAIPTQKRSPLVLLQEGTAAKLPIFCVHPAGGNAMCFYPFASLMSSTGHPIYALEDPNTGDLETYSYQSITDMAKGNMNSSAVRLLFFLSFS